MYNSNNQYNSGNTNFSAQGGSFFSNSVYSSMSQQNNALHGAGSNVMNIKSHQQSQPLMHKMN